jgi:Kdo2-lipid A phosphotransferase
MKFKTLLLCHLLIALLISTFLWPMTKPYWDQCDIFFFRLLNDPLRGNKFLQIFWAFANHKLADWIEDCAILIFFFLYVKQSSEKTRRRKVCELLFCVLYIGSIIFFVNRVLFRETLTLYRDSPTLLLDNCVYLSDELPWMHIKDTSPKCFPADHATTALLFAGSFFYFAGWRLGSLAIIYSIFLCLPRMVTGAHWLSDILAGSGPIVLFFLGWALATPLHLWVIAFFEKAIGFLQERIKRIKGYIYEN